MVMQQCEVCQACQRPSRHLGPIAHTPIPPRVMESVALDVFRMPTVIFEKEKFVTMVVCVDRHSGWIVAIPCLNKGLTGAKVAKDMLKYFGDLLEFPV